MTLADFLEHLGIGGDRSADGGIGTADVRVPAVERREGNSRRVSGVSHGFFFGF